MNLIEIILVAVLAHIIHACNFKSTPDSTEGGEIEVACCFEQFEPLLLNHWPKPKERSAVVLLSDSNEITAPAKISMKQRKDPWSVEIWRSSDFLCLKGLKANARNFVVFQSDEGVQKNAECITCNLLKNITIREGPPNICEVKVVRNESCKCFVHQQCSLLNVSSSIAYYGRKTSRHVLYVAGNVSAPFVYREAENGKLKGIEASLIGTVTEKLQLQLLINVTDESNWRRSSDFPAER